MSPAQNSKFKTRNLNLLPCPRSLKVLRGTFTLPKHSADLILGSARLWRAPVGVAPAGIHLNRDDSSSARDARAPQKEFYALSISEDGIKISFRETGGLRAATATLRQLLRQYGRRLPCLEIRDWPDFPRRGVMLDISRGRVPKLETLLELVEDLADFKINELQLYTEHTFAYRKYKSVWQSWGALTGEEILNSTRAAGNSALTSCRTKIPSATCVIFWKIRVSGNLPRSRAVRRREQRIRPSAHHARAESSGHPALSARALR